MRSLSLVSLHLHLFSSSDSFTFLRYVQTERGAQLACFTLTVYVGAQTLDQLHSVFSFSSLLFPHFFIFMGQSCKGMRANLLFI